ncbi:hypothetical protein Tco_1542877 [Tanacetum coccineum]
MLELREDTFSENKNDNAHEHVERVLDIVTLLNIRGVSHDAVMLYVFPSHSLEPLKDRWTDFLQEPSIFGISLKMPLSKGNACHLKPLSNLKKSATLSRNMTKHYTKLGNGQIPGMPPAQALAESRLWLITPKSSMMVRLDTTHALKIAHHLEKKAKLGGDYEQTPRGVKKKKS